MGNWSLICGLLFGSAFSRYLLFCWNSWCLLCYFTLRREIGSSHRCAPLSLNFWSTILLVVARLMCITNLFFKGVESDHATAVGMAFPDFVASTIHCSLGIYCYCYCYYCSSGCVISRWWVGSKVERLLFQLFRQKKKKKVVCKKKKTV
jgi:hypothetical protein